MTASITTDSEPSPNTPWQGLTFEQQHTLHTGRNYGLNRSAGIARSDEDLWNARVTAYRLTPRRRDLDERIAANSYSIRDWEMKRPAPTDILSCKAKDDRLRDLYAAREALRIESAAVLTPPAVTPDLPDAATGAPPLDKANTTTTADEAESLDTTGMVAWQGAVLESWSIVSARHENKTTARHVMAWCKSPASPRDVFGCKQPPERDSMSWIGRNGGVQTVTYGRIATVVSEWRKAGIIPAR